MMVPMLFEGVSPYILKYSFQGETLHLQNLWHKMVIIYSVCTKYHPSNIHPPLHHRLLHISKDATFLAACDIIQVIWALKR